MMATFFWCLLVLIVGLPVYLLYWNLFRPVLIQRLKYRLFEVRDELRLILISGEISEKEKAYPLVELLCNKGIANVDDVDLAMLLSARVDEQVLLKVKQDLNLIFNAGAPLRQRFLEASSAVFGAACANSPGILILIAPVIIFAVTALWFNKVKSWLYGLLTRAIGNFCFSPI